MSPYDFDHLAGLYLDGEASRTQVLALREALRTHPELRVRLAAHVRLHRAQGQARSSRVRRFAAVLAPLHAFATRAGVALAHACVALALIVGSEGVLPRIEAHFWMPASPRPLVVVPATLAPESSEEASFSPLPEQDFEFMEVAPLPEVREADFLDS